MILKLYWSGRSLSLLGYWYAKKTSRGTIVNYNGRSFRVRETPEQIEALDKADDAAEEKTE